MSEVCYCHCKETIAFTALAFFLFAFLFFYCCLLILATFVSTTIFLCVPAFLSSFSTLDNRLLASSFRYIRSAERLHVPTSLSHRKVSRLHISESYQANRNRLLYLPVDATRFNKFTNSFRSAKSEDSTSSRRKMTLSSKSLAGPGYIILNGIRVMNIIGFLAVITASVVMLVKTSVSSKFFFFDAVGHVLTAITSSEHHSQPIY